MCGLFNIFRKPSPASAPHNRRSRNFRRGRVFAVSWFCLMKFKNEEEERLKDELYSSCFYIQEVTAGPNSFHGHTTPLTVTINGKKTDRRIADAVWVVFCFFFLLSISRRTPQ